MGEYRMLDWLEEQEQAGRKYANFINGEWVDSATGRTSPLYESARPNRKIGDFPDSGEEDVNRAVQAANEVFQSWRNTPGPARAGVLYRFADLLERNREELAYMLSAEQGKVLAESLGEVQRAANEARFAAGEAFRLDGQTLPSENNQIRAAVIRCPIGVVACIAPWNFPIVTPVRKVAPALAYGCTVVLKPASATPWSSVRLMEVLSEAGLPKGVVNLVLGSGSRVGDPLVSHPLVNGVSFTGSTELGLRINGIAAARLAKTQLELGGKNAALVLDYDNLEGAAEQIVAAAFACSGQRCTAISRVIVQKDLADRLNGHIIERMKAIKVGPAWADGAGMGPLIDKKQFESVKGYIDTGKREGAVLAYGGERLDMTGENGELGGCYLQPTLFTGVTRGMTIAKEEIFGPVLSVLEAADWEEAVELANATEYGLAVSIFTDRLELAGTLPDLIDVGMVHINHGTASQAHMPFGGVKRSGFGPFSIGHTNQEFFTNVKAVYTKSR
ncbi:aldehyde dehydrogenase family protein [uncultured Paenibacillus sp.]|uniref:aldehyde dehydrogenase family protein n=1 Tax=uncultured Paenibacillus sp. TaxID=227322 RepID=UPI0028D02538|nr:aldehyde dehydrogenase family protein [uncultured Paenibacillus sp.]